MGRKREGEYRMKNQQNSVHQKRRVRENTNTQGGNGEIKQDERVNFIQSSRKTQTKKYICIYILKKLQFHPGLESWRANLKEFSKFMQKYANLS
jgi:hypothetical protein